MTRSIPARTPSPPPRPQEKPDFRWNQDGYTASGPIFKNRVFFMSNFEGYQDSKTLINNSHGADGAAAVGRLLGTRHTAPRSGHLHRHGLEPIVPAVRGNRIPTNRIDPISQQLLEFYPEPNAPGTVNNYVSRIDRVIDRKQYPAHGLRPGLVAELDGAL